MGRASGRVRASRAPVVPERVPSASKGRWLSWMFGSDAMCVGPAPVGELELRRCGAELWVSAWARAVADRVELELVPVEDQVVSLPEARRRQRVLEEGVCARARALPGWPCLWD